MIEANESPTAAALRELAEELGLTLHIGRPLVIEWVGAHGPWDDQIVFVFDGGTMSTGDVDSIDIREQGNRPVAVRRRRRYPQRDASACVASSARRS